MRVELRANGKVQIELMPENSIEQSFLQHIGTMLEKGTALKSEVCRDGAGKEVVSISLECPRG